MSFKHRYYLYNFLMDFIFAYAIYIILFTSKGLSIVQVSILISWWGLSTAILEIPSGALADNWNRRYMLALAPLCKIGCMLSWYFADGNFWGYGFGFLLWSVALSFRSGTKEAVLYDVLRKKEEEQTYEKVTSIELFFYNIALVTSMSMGGLIAYYDIELPLLLSCIPLAIAIFIPLSFPSTRIVLDANHIDFTPVSYSGHLTEAFKELKYNAALRNIVIYIIFTSGACEMMEEFEQLYLKFLKLPIYSFGLIIAGISLVCAGGNLIAYRLKNKHNICWAIPLAISACLFSIATFDNVYMIFALCLSYFFAAQIRVLANGAFQHKMETDSRATATSFMSLVDNFVGIILTMAFGYISDIYNIQAGYAMMGVIILIISVWAYISKKSGNNILEVKEKI